MREVTLLFDFDGTLVQLDKLGAYRQVVADFGLGDVSDLAESLYRLDNKVCAEGKPDRRAVFEEYIDRFKTKNLQHLCGAFWAQVALGQTLQADCIETLGALKTDGYVLVCVTDTDGTGGDKHNRITKVVREYFSDDRIFIGKENIPYAKDRTTRYFEAVVRKLQVDPTRCIMIGDKVEIDLVPAETIGMQTILVRNKEYGGKWSPQVGRLSKLIPTIKGLECNSHP
jgi:FMN phosphatase YigB (HAD superfamily)